MVIRPNVFADMSPITAGFSTRNGGVSSAPFDTLNLGFSTEDDPDNVTTNRLRFCNALGAVQDQIVEAGQIHGKTVRAVDEPGVVPECDGLVSDTPGVLLCIGTADCAAVLLADPDAGVVGACHSGWRGTAADIATETVKHMVDLGARPQQMSGYVSPCISLDAFEVGPEVAEQFDAKYVEQRAEWDRPHVDLKAVIRDQLTQAGLSSERIEISPYCTMLDNGDFFSYRAAGGITGRMFGAIGRSLRQ
ncbi:copper oxidase [Longibacter salinarum]|uniref:Purine nucleoside phosphorylase n=1 Tax=Longibacter salinarum TaxID=1850348 RepID=A0A2A8CWK5_9BACT|nr:peptidoglycan editing factor PgeF [Longibacter salinarum]PEN13026.1 copper oxidase [Longibacter salinarum]